MPTSCTGYYINVFLIFILTLNFLLKICFKIFSYFFFTVFIAGGKTSVCYVDRSNKGIPIGSTQIGPYHVGNSLLLNYTGKLINLLMMQVLISIYLKCLLFADGLTCKNTLKWRTIIHFTCSDESQIIHDSTNFTSCTYVFKWKSRKACEISVIYKILN